MTEVASYIFDHQAAQAAVTLTAQTGVPHFVSTGAGGNCVVVRAGA